jgi:hypothetical protein
MWNSFTTRAYISGYTISFYESNSSKKKQLFKQLRETKNDSVPHKHVRETSKVVILSDPLLKFVGKTCTKKGYDVRCYPGISLEEM